MTCRSRSAWLSAACRASRRRPGALGALERRLAERHVAEIAERGLERLIGVAVVCLERINPRQALALVAVIGQQLAEGDSVNIGLPDLGNDVLDARARALCRPAYIRPLSVRSSSSIAAI